MRFLSVLAVTSTYLVLASCTSSPSLDDVGVRRPSQETTSSVVRPSNRASRIYTETVESPPVPQEEVLAWAGPLPSPPAFVPAPKTVAMPVPSEEAIARPIPAAPMMREAPQGRMQIYSRRFRDAKPINFGSASPRKLAVHGVDVSRWQGDVDWVNLRSQGANFAYIKATDGGDHIDPMFKTNWRKAKEAGLKRGAYHFFYWCRTAGEQADWFIRNVPREAGALPPAIDVEWNGESSCKRRPSRKLVLEKMQVFMDKLTAYYGQRPIIYTAPDFYRDNLKEAFADYPFWLRAVAEHPSKVYPGRRWLFWQYSGSGLSHGVEGRIDLNVFHGSEDEWHNWVAARSN
ncbi:glycosyl hydrolase (plasmid) [Phyllobacterium sp. 628]|uniref:glycoside hydrolase family 25 protein n=1 Tax=Phyllobacterium sp. 628 TaxID=2718938 RepID=UPI00166248AF|nr:GH25 family lysozyme [Phyllobacterium sp. 628]QND54800.1 glycosyl hydrolase [Phyllobacterium sp. 628]